MSGIINWKICEECGEYFDIGTNYDKCPNCRMKKELKEEKDDGKVFHN